jgi:hypothetical protein
VLLVPRRVHERDNMPSALLSRACFCYRRRPPSRAGALQGRSRRARIGRQSRDRGGEGRGRLVGARLRPPRGPRQAGRAPLPAGRKLETLLPPARASAPAFSRLASGALETCRRQDVFALPDVLAISILETLIVSPVISPVRFTECPACSFRSGMSWLEML